MLLPDKLPPLKIIVKRFFQLLKLFAVVWLLWIFYGIWNFLSDISKIEYYKVYRQRIPNSNLVIYDYTWTGNFVTSNIVNAFGIIDSSETFSKDNVDELPCTYFAKTPTNHDFQMINITNSLGAESKKDTLLTPSHTFIKEIDNIIVTTKEYKNTYGSGLGLGLREYEFDSLKEIEDSLIFYNVTLKDESSESNLTKSFSKGNITVVDSAQGDINYIEVQHLVIKRGDIYPPFAGPSIPNRPIVGWASYRLYPRRVINSRMLSDYGIFKRVK
jgi:hypothetical protein